MAGKYDPDGRETRPSAIYHKIKLSSSIFHFLHFHFTFAFTFIQLHPAHQAHPALLHIKRPLIQFDMIHLCRTTNWIKGLFFDIMIWCQALRSTSSMNFSFLRILFTQLSTILSVSSSSVGRKVIVKAMLFLSAAICAPS